MLVDQVEQVGRAGQLHPRQLNEVDRQQRGERPEAERAEDAVAQRFLLLLARQPEHQHRQHHGVVGTEQALQRHQQRDGDEVGRLNGVEKGEGKHAPPVYRGHLDTHRIKS